MKYENIRTQNDATFRRITGVKRETIEKMLEIIRATEIIRQSKGGPKPTLPLEEQAFSSISLYGLKNNQGTARKYIFERTA